MDIVTYAILSGKIKKISTELGSLAVVATSGSYEDLSHQPQINGVTLVGNKSFEDLGLPNPMVLKGRVNTVADLANISNPQAGWVYFVGLETDTEFAEYVYMDTGSWQFIGYTTITVDSELSITSENPVQNKVVTTAINQNKTDISSLSGHFTFSANSGHYYLQPEQPSSPADGDIWIG